MGNAGFYLYLMFVVSWFLHLPARVPALGVIRFDLLLIILICSQFFLAGDRQQIVALTSRSYRKINYFILLIIVLTPFAYWPGSAIKTGVPTFAKAIVFFYFTVWFVRSESRLKTFITVFILCQSFRVLEPFYLHITSGYWGDHAYLGGGNFMQRLSGAPLDVINPNGLAFVVLMLVPFILYLSRENRSWKMFAVCFLPVALYVLYLTGSRSGLLGLGMVLLMFIFNSRKKVLVAVPIVLASVFLIMHMQGYFKDRYLSIVDDHTQNARTFTHRIEGIKEDFRVAMEHPVFGHGLGTSGEANYHYGGRMVISHTLYA